MWEISHFRPTVLMIYWIVEGVPRYIAVNEMQKHYVNMIPFFFRRREKLFLAFSYEILPFLLKISRAFFILIYKFVCIRKGKRTSKFWPSVTSLLVLSIFNLFGLLWKREMESTSRIVIFFSWLSLKSDIIIVSILPQ